MKHFVVAFLASLLMLAAFAVSASAQSAEVRTIPVVAMDSTGQIVAGLTAQDFRIKGVRATIGNVSLDTNPRRVILFLDISGSMANQANFKQETKFAYAKQMAKLLLSDMTAQDRVALYVFAKRYKQLVPFTHDFPSIAAAIDALPQVNSKAALNQFGGTSRARDALNSALEDNGQDLGFGACFIFLSDGEFSDPGSAGPPLNSLSTTVEQRGVRIFLVLAAADNARDLVYLPASDDLRLREVVDTAIFMAMSGGFSFAPRMFPELSPGASPIFRFDPLEKRIKALSDAIHKTYRLELTFSQPLRKKQRLRLELVNAQGKKATNDFLFYRQVFHSIR